MKRIGVTGAFGFLGANFVKALLETEDDLEIVAFASSTAFNPLFDPSVLRVESLDILDRAGMEEKFLGLDSVAHFAGRVDYRPSMRRAVWDTDALGSKNVFDAALAVGVPRILHVSSVCALGRGLELSLADEEGEPYGDPSWPSSTRERRASASSRYSPAPRSVRETSTMRSRSS
jgi:dihydroflavonol-4-reductase